MNMPQYLGQHCLTTLWHPLLNYSDWVFYGGVPHFSSPNKKSPFKKGNNHNSIAAWGGGDLSYVTSIFFSFKIKSSAKRTADEPFTVDGGWFLEI